MPRELLCAFTILLRFTLPFPLPALFPSDLTLLKRDIVPLCQCENDWSHLGITWPP